MIIRSTVIGVTAVTVLAGCGTETQSGQVGTKDVQGVGTVLVDQTGKTLYFTESDQGGIRCTADCLTIWAPATGSITGTVSGLGTVKRPDNGTEQLTYQGKPLYSFSMDDAQRPASGHNVRDSFGGTEFTWQAVIVQGGQNQPNNGGGGGGYGPGGY